MPNFSMTNSCKLNEDSILFPVDTADIGDKLQICSVRPPALFHLKKHINLAKSNKIYPV